MALHDAPTDQLPAPSPDAAFAVAVGGYLGVLLTAPVVLAGAAVGLDSAGLYVLFLASLTVLGTLAGVACTRLDGLAVRVGRTRARWLLLVGPVAAFVAGLLLPLPGDTALGAVVGTVTAIGTLVFAIALNTMSQTRYARAVLAASPEHRRFEARWPARYRRLATVGGGVAVAIAVVVTALRVGFGVEWAQGWLAFVGFYLWAPLAGLSQSRTVVVTDAGLVFDTPAYRRFRAWDRYDRVEQTDGALVVHASAPWRPATRFDSADIDDPEAVVRALRHGVEGAGAG